MFLGVHKVAKNTKMVITRVIWDRLFIKEADHGQVEGGGGGRGGLTWPPGRAASTQKLIFRIFDYFSKKP